MLNGRQLREIFAQLDPFSAMGEIKAESERRTLLAVNVNRPAELQLRGFLAAAAAQPGSPLILQASHNALKRMGGEGREGLVRGGRLFASNAHLLNEEYGAQLVALALDHFRVPPYPHAGHTRGSCYQLQAKARLEDASDYLVKHADLEAPGRSQQDELVHYLASQEYQEFLEDFCELIDEIRPAYAMIDTENLPPSLTAAVARQVGEKVRTVLGPEEMLLEVEYGATGRSPKNSGYTPLRGEALQRFARQVSALVHYAEADAISYPIGMVHGAALNERHEPDQERLYWVQQRIRRDAGHYVPFVQHGGSGARILLRGLVGKNNLNTTFLIAQTQAIAKYTVSHERDIRLGEKNACSGSLFDAAVVALQQAVERRLDEAGTRRAGQWLQLSSARP